MPQHPIIHVCKTNPSEKDRLALPLTDTGMDTETRNILMAYHIEILRDLLDLISFDLLHPDKRWKLHGILTENQAFEATSTCRVYVPYSLKMQENAPERFYDLTDMCRQVMDKHYDEPPFADACSMTNISELLSEQFQKHSITELQQFITSIATGQFYQYCTIDPNGTARLLFFCEQFLKYSLHLSVKIHDFKKRRT